VSARRKAESCSKKCNQEFYNQKYQRQGKFMKHYETTKQDNIDKAKRLKDRGHSIEFIMAQTSLTKLGLIRGNVLQRDEM
jgi:hypothetical protein